jgi:hypothetical protein
MKRFIISLIVPLLILISLSVTAQTVHGVIVADTKDPSIGEAAKEDSKRIAAFLGLIGEALDYEVAITLIAPANNSILFGSRFETSEITSIILNLNMNKDDIFFFYYSGHGLASRDDDDPFARPVIGADKYNYLSLQMIQKLVRIHEPRLSFVMGSLCNSFPGGSSNPKYAEHIAWDAPKVLNRNTKANITALFAQLEGTVTVTSSNRGMTSFAQKDGGVFTKLFINSFNQAVENSYASPSWVSLLAIVAKASTESHDRTPYYEINLTSKTQ